MDEKILKIGLPGVPAPAVIVLHKAGQVPPSWGDDVRVVWELQLPADPKNIVDLHPEIRFGSRIGSIAGKYLDRYWKEKSFERDGSPYVARTAFVSAPKWAAAFKQAEDYVIGELHKLLTALRNRQAALMAADDE